MAWPSTSATIFCWYDPVRLAGVPGQSLPGRRETASASAGAVFSCPAWPLWAGIRACGGFRAGGLDPVVVAEPGDEGRDAVADGGAWPVAGQRLQQAAVGPGLQHLARLHRQQVAHCL